MIKLGCILFVFVYLLSACNLFEKSYPAYIIAGKTAGDGIEYTDIEPDDTLILSGHPDTLELIRPLDLNSDGINDFEILFEISSPLMLGGNFTYMYLVPLNNNSIAVNNLTDNWAQPIPISDSISANYTWGSAKTTIYGTFFTIPDNYSYYGFWGTDSDKYVGVKIVDAEHELYGWIDFARNIIRAYAISKPL